MSDFKREFALFNCLSDDLKVNILSYVADAPLESISAHKDINEAPRPINYSSLTHQLPYVSRKFKQISETNTYWRDALRRMAEREPLWRLALSCMKPFTKFPCYPPPPRLFPKHQETTTVSEPLSKHRKVCIRTSTHHDVVDMLIEQAHTRMAHPSYKFMYRQIISYHLRCTGPVFVLPGHVLMGEAYSLSLEDPLHQRMLQEIIKSFPAEAQQGGPVPEQAWFLHANRSPADSNVPAILSQIQRCQVEPGERAELVLLPKAHVWLEHVWKDKDGIMYAQCLRMGQLETRQMNQLSRQETLAQVMTMVMNEYTQHLARDEGRAISDDESSDSSMRGDDEYDVTSDDYTEYDDFSHSSMDDDTEDDVSSSDDDSESSGEDDWSLSDEDSYSS